MGRRALQCSPKQGASCQSQLQFNDDHVVVMISEQDQHSFSSQTSSTYNKGLDRVLLERNIEKLLERPDKPSSQMHPQSMCRQGYQNRSREPIDLTDLGLSLDNLSPKTKTSIDPSTVNQSLKRDAMTTSSMPELPVYELTKFDDITPINEELPTPDISELTMRGDEPSQPICEFFFLLFSFQLIENFFRSHSNDVEEGSSV